MKALLTITLSLSTLLIFADGKEKKVKAENVPEKVQATYAEKFPDADKAQWVMEEEKEGITYEVEFTMDGKNMEATFTEGGEWLETETEISTADMSGAMMLVLEAKYSTHMVEGDKAQRIEKADGTILYEVIFQNSSEEVEMTFTESGSLYEAEEEE